jgi:hypothetical protein
MNRWSEREIARKLAEREPLEPPAGLLEKIKGEIPPTLPVGVPQPEARRPSPPPRRWLIAASLVAMVGAGFFALRLRTEAPRMEAVPTGSPAVEREAGARAEPGPRPSAPPPEAVPQGPGGTALPTPPPASPKLLAKKEQDQLKALGYVGPQARAEQQLQAGVSGGVVGGVSGGTVAAAPPPAAPVAAPQPKPRQEETTTVTAESALPDERRISTGATVNQAELEKIPTAKNSPGTAKDRINVGGNEGGRQSDYVGPGQPFVDVAAHPVSTFRLNAGTAAGGAARRDLAAGKPSDAVPSRVDAPVNYYDFDAFEPMPVQGAVAITAEGAPAPFAHGPRYRLLRFHITGAPTGSPVEVGFNPAVVARYRMVGDGATGLYEIELRPDAPGAGRVATVRLSEQPGSGRDLELSAFAPSWEKASPGFRLVHLAARFGEIQRGSPATAGELDEIARQVREAGKGLPASARAAELADRVEKAARARN